MRHRTCNYCWEIGHEPEMDIFVKPEYFLHGYNSINKYGLAWSHKKCYEKHIKKWILEQKVYEEAE